MDEFWMNTINNLKLWIKGYIEFSKASGVIVGISGGKDSLVVAKLCIDALGNDKVLGIIMPNGEMRDLDIAKEVCETLNLKYYVVNIENTVNEIMNSATNVINQENANLSTITTLNIPPRVRTNTLYAIAGSLNYLVANTSNLSEITVGYTTKWGDNIGDFAPLANFTKTEVCKIGKLLGLPNHLVYKTPDDGLSGKTDEEKLGVSYDEIDKLIRLGESDEEEKILALIRASAHKREGVIDFKSHIRNCLDE